MPAPVPIGTMISELTTPNLVTVLSVAGFDHVVVDCEHGPFSYEDVAAFVAVGRHTETRVHVRIPEISRAGVTRYLDLGVAGLIAPMVSTAEQARDLVRWARYPPLGHRGVSTQRPHTGYRVDDLAGYLAQANRTVELHVQIETAEALSNINQIAAVAGISGLVLGPNDLLTDLGHPGGFDRPELADAVELVATVAADAGQQSGVITSRAPLLGLARDLGMRFLVWNSEIGLLLGPAGDALDNLRRTLTKENDA